MNKVFAQTELPEVWVRASTPISFAIGTKIQTIDTSKYQNSLGEVLENQTLTFMKNYGNSMLSSVSLRGTGANHTALLWNGVNLNSPNLGMSDMSLFSASVTDKIQVYYGSGSAIFGSDALGGTISLQNLPTWNPQTALNFQQDVGSFGKYQGNFKLKVGPNSKLESHSRGDWLWLKNDFSFKNTSRFGSPIERINHASVRKLGFHQDLFWRVSPKVMADFHLWAIHTFREIQPTMSQRMSQEHQSDAAIRMQGNMVLSRKNGSLSFKTAYFKEFQHYENIGIDAHYLTTRWILRGERSMNYKNLNSRIGAEYQYITAEIGERKVSENRTDVYLMGKFLLNKRLSSSISLRQVLVNNQPIMPSFAFGGILLLKKTNTNIASFRGTVSQSYRLPTLNERFWQPGGNPEIRPELGRMVEIGFDANHSGLKVSAGIYHSIIGNYIQWLPEGNSGIWSPKNLKTVQADGIETELKKNYTISNEQSFDFYTQITIVKSRVVSSSNILLINTLGQQMPYVPFIRGIGGMTYHHKKVTLQINFNGVGIRNTVADASQFLPGYVLMNIQLQKDLSIKNQSFLASISINNVLNTAYQVIENRAMPLRNYDFRLRFTPNYQKKP